MNELLRKKSNVLVIQHHFENEKSLDYINQKIIMSGFKPLKQDELQKIAENPINNIVDLNDISNEILDILIEVDLETWYNYYLKHKDE